MFTLVREDNFALLLAIGFLLVMGGLWWETGGKALTTRSLKKQGLHWLFPSWHILTVLLTGVGLLFNLAWSWYYFVSVALGSLAVVMFLKAYTVIMTQYHGTTTTLPPSSPRPSVTYASGRARVGASRAPRSSPRRPPRESSVEPHQVPEEVNA
jgi:hypothetical protein